jgi:hypothetical protein
MPADSILPIRFPDPGGDQQDNPTAGQAVREVARCYKAGAERSTHTLLEPLLVPTPEAARISGISEASWHRLRSAGKTPAPIRLGGKVLYRIGDLKLWIELGCPDRRSFEARKNAGK